jgi:hypothetical protein
MEYSNMGGLTTEPIPTVPKPPTLSGDVGFPQSILGPYAWYIIIFGFIMIVIFGFFLYEHEHKKIPGPAPTTGGWW